MTIKVAVIEPVGGHGGMDYYDDGLCTGLANVGVVVSLHTCDKTVRKKEGILYKLNIDYRGIYGDSSLFKRGIRYARSTLIVLAKCLLEDISICHFHFFKLGFMEALNVILSKVIFRKIVVTIHDVESLSGEKRSLFISKIIIALTDRIIVHNKISKAELMHIYEIEDRMVDVIQHGNYLNMLGNPPEKMNAKECLGLPQNSKVLLFFGQIKEVKGLDIILDALPEVLLAYPEVILLVAGRPWKISFNTYLERMKKLGIQDKCICHIRYIDNDEVPIYYSAADLVLLPYRKIYQSGVVLMAMSYGKPVLVSDLPGMKEIVTDGVTGFIFTSGSSESLASRLKQILLMWEDVSLVAEIGLNHVKQNYSWSTVGNLTKGVYEKIIHPN